MDIIGEYILDKISHEPEDIYFITDEKDIYIISLLKVDQSPLMVHLTMEGLKLKVIQIQ